MCSMGSTSAAASESTTCSDRIPQATGYKTAAQIPDRPIQCTLKSDISTIQVQHRVQCKFQRLFSTILKELTASSQHAVLCRDISQADCSSAIHPFSTTGRSVEGQLAASQNPELSPNSSTPDPTAKQDTTTDQPCFPLAVLEHAMH